MIRITNNKNESVPLKHHLTILSLVFKTDEKIAHRTEVENM